MRSTLMLDEQERQTIAKVLAAWSDKTRKVITLDNLLMKWADFVRVIERGYEDSIYEYTNDLSVRDILEDILLAVQEPTRAKIEEVLRPFDNRFSEATKAIKRALVSAVEEGPTRTWWFRIPKKLSEELEKDLRSEGLLD